MAVTTDKGAALTPLDVMRDAAVIPVIVLDDVAQAVAGVPDLDLTTELITHRFTPKSKQVLLGWYPRTQLEMDEDLRRQKRGKFGAVKHVYPAPVMAELRQWFEHELAATLPAARVLYWT